MTYYYVDSSVLVKRHIQEQGTAWVEALVDSPYEKHLMITSIISVVEVYSALNRKVREKRISLEKYRLVTSDFAHFCANTYRLVPVSLVIIKRASLLIEHYPLRAYDAIQLASALITNDTFRAQNVSSIIFLSSDQRLLEIADLAGLATDNPNDHTVDSSE